MPGGGVKGGAASGGAASGGVASGGVASGGAANSGANNEGSVRQGPVSLAALDALLEALREAGGWTPLIDGLLDRDLAARVARRFKLDLSFAMGADGARFSLNDKDEVVPFRERLRANIGGPALESFLALSPPGAVQTTVGLKARDGALQRISLYYEELPTGEAGEALRRSALALAGVSASSELPSVAVCLDLDAGGQIVAAKDYGLIEGSAGPFPEERAGFPAHPVTGNRRFLYARRFAPGGAMVGSKLMWMSETHRPSDVARAWAEVDRLCVELPPDRASRALDKLRRSWSFSEAFLHPDLLSTDRDAEGRVRAVLAYVSVR